jgi:hypothetical protein
MIVDHLFCERFDIAALSAFVGQFAGLDFERIGAPLVAKVVASAGPAGRSVPEPGLTGEQLEEALRYELDIMGGSGGPGAKSHFSGSGP